LLASAFLVCFRAKAQTLPALNGSIVSNRTVIITGPVP
jgi:hypothetical protein